MGLGPSMKMTTLHHYHCPLTAELGRQTDIAFAGILVDGVSELCDDKIFTAKRTAQLAAMMEAYGAIVTVDGLGNHHVDFVNVIEQLGRRGIPAVGVSFFGEQGKLVCTGDYLDCLLDINKTSSGVETCVVGRNNLTPEDAYKAVGLLKYRMRKAGKTASGASQNGPLRAPNCCAKAFLCTRCALAARRGSEMACSRFGSTSGTGPWECPRTSRTLGCRSWRRGRTISL